MEGNTEVSQYDVVVVGAGNAGLIAALSAHEAGAKVVVLEVAPRSSRGGNCYFTGGGYRVPLRGLDEVRELVPNIPDAQAELMDMQPYTEDHFYSAWMRVTQGLADPELVQTVVTQSNPTVRWMLKQGVIWELYLSHSVKINGRLKWMPGNLYIGGNGGGAGLSDMLFDLVEKKGVALLYETKVINLLVNSKARVCGVTVKDCESFRDIRSKAVILACGGFEANREMRARYLGGKWELARVRGTRYNTGRGIEMALEIGAQPEGHWVKCHGTLIDSEAPYNANRATGDKTNRQSYPLGILVNINGQRFIDEGEDTRQFTYAKLGEAVLTQPHGIGFQIFDSKVEHLLEDRYSTAIGARANTIRELAEELDIEPATLVQTVDQYNEAVQEGTFNPANKDGKRTAGIRPPKSNWAQRLDTPPFLAYAVTGGITFTYGGLKINPKAQVIDTENNAIPGLYAAGEIVGGMFYHNYPGGSCLTGGAVFGRLAGVEAAKES